MFSDIPQEPAHCFKKIYSLSKSGINQVNVGKPMDIITFQAGYDCGKNGPNQNNCHFSWFSTPEQTKAWEAGKAKAEQEQQPRDSDHAS